MAKLTIQDVFAMFEPFGISSQQVNRILDSCKDKSQAFNLFEGLKAQATIRYEEMRGGEVSVQRFQEIKPTYERLMGIRLKNYTPKRKPQKQTGSGKIRDSKTFNQVLSLGDMMAKKDVDGIMRLLDSDPADPKERKVAEAIIRQFENITKRRGK